MSGSSTATSSRTDASRARTRAATLSARPGLRDARGRRARGPRRERIWSWTRDNLRRDDGLLAFLWRDGRIEDPQAASDADLDAARAFALAACRFDSPALAEEARRLGEAILAEETTRVGEQTVLVAGPWAHTTPATLNPSYFAPGSYEQLARAEGASESWTAIDTSSREILASLVSDPGRLPPDWARIDGSGVAEPAGPPAEQTSPPRFGFDAARTLVRYAEASDPSARALAAGAWRFFETRPPEEIVVEHEPSGSPSGAVRHPVGLVAAAGAAHAAGARARARSLLDAAERLDERSPTYYGAAWVALGRLMLTTERLTGCDR